MCGILAIANELVSREKLASMLDTISHRGPDAKAYWQSQDSSTSLAHCQLHMSGSHPGAHPVRNETGSIRAVVNGEFYDYQKIRGELEAAGHRFHSDCDSELLVHLYEAYGYQCLDHLIGEFAFVLWDEENKTLFAARDRYGIKPLVYQSSAQGITLASEAKAILSKGTKWNQQALHSIFTHQYLSPSQSIFEGIQQIPPAHYLLFKEQNLQLIPYYQKPNTEEGIADEEWISLIQKGLSKALRRRLHPHAAFSLSGGIDSSSLVTLAAKQQTEPVPCFTISFEDQRYDETALAAERAKAIGGSFHPVEVSATDRFDLLEQAVTAAEGVTINGQMAAKYKLNQAIHDAGYKAVISAEGADEAFMGYAHLAMDAGLPGTPNNLQNGIMLSNDNPTVHLQKWPHFIQAKAQFYQGLQNLLCANFLNSFTPNKVLETHFGGYLDDPRPIVRANAAWTNFALSGYILRSLGDGTEMPHSIEGRVPYLDHELFDLAWSIPTSKKLNPKGTKVILREALKGILPQSLCNRPKHPLLAPPLIQNQKQLEQVKEVLFDRSPSFLDKKKINSWLQSLKPEDFNSMQSQDPLIHILLSLTYLEHSYSLSL